MGFVFPDRGPASRIASWRPGFRPALFMMVAWLGMLVSLILLLLVRLGIASSTLLNENIYKLGLIWMAVCWSIALADRINLLKAKTESANRNLRNSEHRLSQILESMPLGVMLYGKDHKPRYINQRTVDILSDPAQGIKRISPSGVPWSRRFSITQSGWQAAVRNTPQKTFRL